MGSGAYPDWPGHWQRWLLTLKGHQSRRLAVIQLLRGEPKTELRRSLKRQLIEWLHTPPEGRRFETPFSPKQWGALTNRFVVRRAKHIDKDLYWCRPMDHGLVTWIAKKERKNDKVV